MASSSQTFDITLKHPSRIIIFGPSSSGKSSLVLRMLDSSEEIFGHKFDEILYISGQAFPSINFVNGIELKKFKEIDQEIIDELNPEKTNLIIFDDNIYVTNDRLLSDLFTKFSHHRNITVIVLLQNLFPKTKYSRDISINSNYIILMANPREATQVKRLSQQIDGTNFIFDCYKDATRNRPFSYLLLDFEQDTPDFLRVRSSLFPNEEIISYVKKQK